MVALSGLLQYSSPVKTPGPNRFNLHTFDMSDPRKTPGALRGLPNLIFASRWLQLPLYIGLIAAQALYVFHFWVELVHLVEAAFGNRDALALLVKSVGYSAETEITGLNETIIMLVVLGLIDVVMISNLLIMVIVGGYETFVSRLELQKHPDQPEWLSHVNASVLKIKLAMAIIGISSIHLLRTFIYAGQLGTEAVPYTEAGVMWQVIIHALFVFSAIGIAYVEKLSQAAYVKPRH